MTGIEKEKYTEMVKYQKKYFHLYNLQDIISFQKYFFSLKYPVVMKDKKILYKKIRFRRLL